MSATGLLRELNGSTVTRERLIERAIAEGKFPESPRGHGAKLHAKDAAATERLIAKLAPAGSLKPPGTGLF